MSPTVKDVAYAWLARRLAATPNSIWFLIITILYISLRCPLPLNPSSKWLKQYSCHGGSYRAHLMFSIASIRSYTISYYRAVVLPFSNFHGPVNNIGSIGVTHTDTCFDETGVRDPVTIHNRLWASGLCLCLALVGSVRQGRHYRMFELWC